MSFYPRGRERRARLPRGLCEAVAAGWLATWVACASGTHGEPASAPTSVPVRGVTAAPEPAAATAATPIAPAAAPETAPSPPQNIEPTAPHPYAELPDLNVAAYEGRIADVRKLLLAGAPIDAHDNQGSSALMAALRKYSSEPKTSATSLKRADPKTDPRQTRKLQVAMLLIDRGANVTLANALGFTALHYAASFVGDDKAVTEVIDSLIAHGAAVNQPTDPTYARTPLELALDQPDPGRIARLLELGANPKQTTHEGKSLPEVAEQNGYPAIAALLRAAK